MTMRRARGPWSGVCARLAAMQQSDKRTVAVALTWPSYPLITLDMFGAGYSWNKVWFLSPALAEARALMARPQPGEAPGERCCAGRGGLHRTRRLQPRRSARRTLLFAGAGGRQATAGVLVAPVAGGAVERLPHTKTPALCRGPGEYAHRTCPLTCSRKFHD
jgi:hypothetical protein